MSIVLDDGEMVGAVSNDEIEFCEGLSARASQREIDDAQWIAFIALDRWRVAVHESGHAIVAVQFGLELEHVSLCEETHLGETCLRGKADAMSADHPRRNADLMKKFFAAGAAAEQIVFDTYNRHGIAEDLSEFSRLAERSAFDQILSAVSEQLSLAQVLAIARPLEQKGFLSVHRVKSLLMVEDDGSHGFE